MKEREGGRGREGEGGRERGGPITSCAYTQGRCAGIIIGCTIGMAPLLWFDDPHKDSESVEHKK